MKLLQAFWDRSNPSESDGKHPIRVAAIAGDYGSDKFSLSSLARLSDSEAFERFLAAFSRMFTRDLRGEIRLIKLQENPGVLVDLANTANELGSRGYSEKHLEEMVKTSAPELEDLIEEPWSRSLIAV